MPDQPVTLRIDARTGDEGIAVIAHRAITELASGGAVILPTDTVYGVGAHPERPGAVDRLFALKGREHTKALAVLVADQSQALEMFDLSTLRSEAVQAVQAMMATAWPGALTVVGPRAERWQRIDLGGDASTIGVRVPDAAVVRAIATVVGPIVVTSANRSGEATPQQADAAAHSLAGQVGLVVDAGPCEGIASTVVDVTTDPFTVIRQGPLTIDDLGVDTTLFAVRPHEMLGSQQ